MKNIIIFGASGRTGIELVKQALANGHRVTAFVRNPAKLEIKHPLLTKVQGSVLNQQAVLKAIAGHDTVVVALGMPAKDRSWLRADGTQNIVRAMEHHGIKRLICQSSLGFADSVEVLPFTTKYIIVPFLLKHAFADHEKQEAHIRSSNLDWTIVRPGNMTNGKRTGRYKVGFEPTAKIKLKVSRADVAELMLKQVNDTSHLHEAIGISY